MKRSAFLPRLATGLGAVAATLAASCGDPTDTLLTELNLDRPVDIAFACYGAMRITNGGDGSADDVITTTAQPRESCDDVSPQLTLAADAEQPHPKGQQKIGDVDLGTPVWYGFILQSASGTVALASWPSKSSETFAVGDAQILDADPLTPGKNAISVGEDPVAIATDRSGCYEVTANAGSCDLSLLDVNSAIVASTAPSSARIRVDRIPVMIGTRPMLAKPAAMLAELAQPAIDRDPATEPVGTVCRRTADDHLSPSGIVYIAYPGCHLVAAVDMSSGVAGQVVGGVQFSAAGVPAILTPDALANLSCASECTGELPAPGIRPVALDVRFDTNLASGSAASPRRLAIGAENSGSLTMVELGRDYLPTSVSQLALEDTSPTKSLGITGVSLSPRIGMGGTMGDFDDTSSAGGPGQYVYAVASDNTVRVADVLDPAHEKECDTQVDTRFARSIRSVPQLQCLPIGTPRRSGAHSPGIHLPDDSVPTSVAIFRGRTSKLSTNTTDFPTTPTEMVGYFAMISSSSGRSFVVNVDDDFGPDVFSDANPVATSPALVMAHQLRDNYGDRGAAVVDATKCTSIDPTGVVLSGGPRSSALPTRNIPTGTLPAEYATEMPALRQVRCDGPDTAAAGLAVSELSFNAEPDTVPPSGAMPPTLPAKSGGVRDVAYPDLRNITNETWTMTWEGPLSLSASPSSLITVDGPQVRSAQMVVDSNGMRLLDQTQPFCEMGVERYDIVQFRGCNPANGNTDCPSGDVCYVHPRSKVSGVGSCMPVGEADRLSNACFDFLATYRRYTVDHANADQLRLLPRKHELYATPINGCDLAVPDQCNTLARYVAKQNAAADPFVERQTEWSCQTDPQRAPINSDPALNNRCVQTCAFHSTDEQLKASGDPRYDGIDRDADCAAGTICVGATSGAGGGVAARGTCMESVLPPPACVTGPQMFDVRASEAFTVIGSASGYIHPIVKQANGSCGPDTSAAAQAAAGARRIQIGRVPLKAPACDPTADPITGALPGGGFEPNPCSTTLEQADVQRNYAAGALQAMLCDNLDTANPAILVPRTADAIKFSNRSMTVHLVDPTYPGDEFCPQDRLGTFAGVSFIVPGASPTATGYQLSFDQRAGFSPMVAPSLSAAYPVKVVRGPSESIWVLDDGDVLPTVLGVPATRGQVFRVESVSITTVNLLQ